MRGILLGLVSAVLFMGCFSKTPDPEEQAKSVSIPMEESIEVSPDKPWVVDETSVLEAKQPVVTNSDVAEPNEMIIVSDTAEPTAVAPTPLQECPKTTPCPVCPKAKRQQKKVIVNDFDKLVVGELEEVYLPIHKLDLKARIDTGAVMTSIHALDIVAFERDGKKWVRFEVLDQLGERHKIKRPVIRTIKIKRHGMESQQRYVVKMRLNLSNLSKFAEVSLTDRTKYKYPVLIGRNYLNGSVIVDVSKRFTKKPTRMSK